MVSMHYVEEYSQKFCASVGYRGFSSADCQHKQRAICQHVDHSEGEGRLIRLKKRKSAIKFNAINNFFLDNKPSTTKGKYNILYSICVLAVVDHT